MKPVDFEGSNRVLKAPAGMANCGDLHVRAENGVVTSCWELEPGELKELVVSRCIVVQVHSGETSPPIGLAGLVFPNVWNVYGKVCGAAV